MTLFLEVALLALGFIVMLLVRFTYPELMETPLLMRFWFVWLGVLLLIVLMVILKVRRGLPHENRARYLSTL